MIVLQTIAVAFAMFSAVPVPQFAWNEKNMRYALCAFPLVGLLCGALWCVCGVLPLPAPARAAGFCLVPVWVTGGIHLDGYADTCDALASYGDREKKLEILKDPHCGAFAVIRLCSYFLAYFALCTCVSFTPRVGVLWVLALVLERALSGLAVASFPMAKNTGLAHTFATAADKTVVRRVLAVLAAVLCVGMAALGGWALVLAALAVLWRYHAVSWKQFGGIKHLLGQHTQNLVTGKLIVRNIRILGNLNVLIKIRYLVEKAAQFKVIMGTKHFHLRNTGYTSVHLLICCSIQNAQCRVTTLYTAI